MVTVYREQKWKITVYGGEPHGLPHYHVEGPGFRSSVDIATGTEIVGNAPKPVLKAAWQWAEAHQQDLLDKYQELNS